MNPNVVLSGNAKEVLMRDADFNTPQDHYFAYLQRKKSGHKNTVEMENEVLLGLDLDQSIALYDLHQIFNQ